MVGSVMNTGVYGIRTGMNMLAKNGHEIARANIPPEQGGTEDLEKPLAGLEESKVQVQASTKVVQAGSDTIGTLLDIKV